MTVRWRAERAADIPDQAALDPAVPSRGRAPGSRSSSPSTPIRRASSRPAASARSRSRPGSISSRAPTRQVKRYIVGNEPNLTRFWRPQGTAPGGSSRRDSFGRVPRRGLRRAEGGPTRDHRARRRALAARQRHARGAGKSQSPVRFLAALGAWYRASGRTTPLMDGFSFHPYPNPSDFDGSVHLATVAERGRAELGRIKQALWDAFHGTPQPTTRERAKLYLDEVGWQVDTATQPGYRAARTSRSRARRRRPPSTRELVRCVVCDPTSPSSTSSATTTSRPGAGWQAALRRTDGSERAAHAAVAAAIAETGGECWGPPRAGSRCGSPSALR